jgi:predicted dehydrogenase
LADIGTHGDLVVTELRAAVIGLGVGERHVLGYEADPRCKVVALCDFDENRLSEVGSRYPRCRVTTDSKDILMDPAINVVSIASYDSYHCDQVVSALQNGKHVFVEKPLCLTEDELSRIVAALAGNPSLHLSSNLVLRRSPQFVEIKRRIERGQMGAIYHMEGEYNYGRIEKITNGWRGRQSYYSVMHGGGIHLIDLMLWLSADIVTDVVAISNGLSTENTQFQYDDMVTALLRFKSGMTAKVAANFGCVVPHHHGVSVHGTKASFIHGIDGGKYYSDRDPAVPPEAFSLQYLTSEKTQVQRSFVAQILDAARAEVSVMDVLGVMAVSLAIERSLKSGAWEQVAYPELLRVN